MTEHKIYRGNALKFLKDEELFPSNSIHLIFADPPYNLSIKDKIPFWNQVNGKLKVRSFNRNKGNWDLFSEDKFFKFNKEWLQDCVRILKPGGSLWVCGSFHNIYQIGYILQTLPYIKVNNSIVWFKPNGMPNISRRMFTESTEHLIWVTKNKGLKKWTFNYNWARDKMEDKNHIKVNTKGKQGRNVWVIPQTPPSEKWAGKHPTQKPEELLRRIIMSTSKRGDLVLDPFAGSGTTLKVAKELGRKSIGIEKSKRFCKIIEKRLTKI